MRIDIASKQDAIIKHEKAETTDSQEYKDAVEVFYKRIRPPRNLVHVRSQSCQFASPQQSLRVLWDMSLMDIRTFVATNCMQIH